MLFLSIVISLLMVGNCFMPRTKNCITNNWSISIQKHIHVTQESLFFPLLSLYDDNLEEEESSKSPLDQFLQAFEESILNESLLKLTLSENASSESSNKDNDGSISINMKEIEEWKAISGRLIKLKSATKLQLNCYKDKSMKKSDLTQTYTTSEEALEAVKFYILKAFKKAMLSTKESDFELKMKKGQGKFRSTSKVSQEIRTSHFHFSWIRITS
jgi:hypothetical protein